MGEIKLSEKAQGLKVGRYRHYKGGEYQVLGVGIHSETLEELVVYQSVEVGQIWVRPLKMFLEKVQIDDEDVPRFRFLG